MNHKKIILFCSLFFLLAPIVNVDAFVHFDYIKDGNYQFFLFDLQTGNNTQISVNHDESGNFTLFLFNKRPVKSYVNADKSLSENIFLNPSLVDFSLVDQPYINYTAPETKIYYIEIILVSGGPDTYNLTILPDGYTVTRYYLPIISSFGLEFILISILSTLGLVYFLLRKKLIRRS